MKRSIKSTINLCNSIVGASILAMPFCFKHCGIVLSIAIVSLSALLNQFSCYLLLKSAIINRRRNYELLAFDVFGSSGKTFVEVGILFFLLGTCIAFFVIVGDIGPNLVAHIFGIENGQHLRVLTMIVLALLVIFPLGLLRNVDNLTSFSMMSLLVYLFLGLKMLSSAFDKFLSPTSINIWNQINYWDSSYIITYLPIFSMALSCQTQLFEIFHSDLFQTETRPLKSIMRSVKRAIYITSFVYIIIGFFGYIAFYDNNITGNILQNLPSGFWTQITLLFFLITLLTSFPLCLFPCRTSLHSLLFRKGGYNDFLSTAHSVHMSDFHFKLLTIVLIITTMGISVIFPHVELVLALVGSTIGSTICFIFPALIFIKLSDKNTIDYLMSYMLVFFGAVILVFCTFSVVYNISITRDTQIEQKITEVRLKSTPIPFIPAKSTFANQFKPLPPTELKSRINNINKLKQSIQLDINNMKKHENDILQRLEKQQQEHSKLIKEQQEIIKELKTHDKIFHENKPEPALNISSPVDMSISLKITGSKQSIEQVKIKQPVEVSAIKPVAILNKSAQSFVLNRSEQIIKSNMNMTHNKNGKVDNVVQLPIGQQNKQTNHKTQSSLTNNNNVFVKQAVRVLDKNSSNVASLDSVHTENKDKLSLTNTSEKVQLKVSKPPAVKPISPAAATNITGQNKHKTDDTAAAASPIKSNKEVESL